MKGKSDHCSKFSNLSNWKEEAWKYQGFNGKIWKFTVMIRDSSLLSTTAVQTWIISYILHIISLHGKIWTQQIDLASKAWPCSSVGRALHRYRRGHEFESRSWSPDIFQASSFQLLKLENLLRLSLFTFIYNPCLLYTSPSPRDA